MITVPAIQVSPELALGRRERSAAFASRSAKITNDEFPMKTLVFIFALMALPCGHLLAAAAPHDSLARTNISSFGAFPCWSPDSRRIAFSICGCVRARGGIWVFDLQTRKTQQVHDTGFFPSWSPTGDRIAFVHDSHLMLLTVDGGEVRDTGLKAGSQLQWSPDGRFILCAEGNFSPAKALILTDAISWTQTHFDFAMAGPHGDVTAFTWTPAGSILITAPIRGADEWLKYEIREFTLEGHHAKSITLGGFFKTPYGIRTSSDGKNFLFGEGGRGIWMANSDGSSASRILPVGAAPAWSPDKWWIVYDDSSSTSDTHKGIFLLDIRSQLP